MASKVASIPDRIRGGIAALCTIASLTAGANVDDKQWQVTFVIAGICYMMTTLAYVFDNYDGT
jgi:hypothetical protein